MNRDLMNKIETDNDFDSTEQVAFWFDANHGDGCWCWQYSLYDRAGRQLLMRRIGELPLQNPRVGLHHLHRALTQDQKLGAYIPSIKEWQQAGAGDDAGFVFTQRQRLARAERIRVKAEA